MPKAPSNLRSWPSLIEIIAALRGPKGCPWDKKQTSKTLTRYAIEEAHELVDAIESENTHDIKDELGDVLLQVVLHSQIQHEAGAFDIDDVIEGLAQKMVRRHPHVFSDQAGTQSPEDVERSWQEIKNKEKPKKLFDFPSALPSLMAAQKIGSKTRHDFDWKDPSDVEKKVKEEWSECHAAIQSGDHAELEMELGDLLFSIAQWCRHLQVDADKALKKANNKFCARYESMNQLIESSGLSLSQLSDEEKERFWQQAKELEK